MTKRIYVVSQVGGNQYLVKASSQAEAIRAITSGHYKAAPATADEVASMMQDSSTKIHGAADGEATTAG